MSNLNNKFAELQADKKEQLPSLENMFTDMAIERQKEAITNLKVFRDVTPEAGVSAIESSQEFGVPLPYTLRKQKEYEAERARKRQQEALINSTALSTFMADPQNAIMTSDSVAELAELERRLHDLAPGRGALAEITDVPRSVAAGAASLVGTGVRGIGETYRTAEEIQATLGIASGLEETYEAPGDNILMDVGGNVAELADIIRPEEQGFVDQVAEGLGQIAGAVGISFLPGGQAATMALFAGAGADQQAQRMRALGIDPASRPMDLAMGAGITGGSEALRLGSVLKVLPRSVRNRLAGGIMARIAGQAGEEAIQEAFENIAQNMVAQGYDPEARLFEGAIESATIAGTSAAVFQALVEATLPGRQKQLNAQNFQKNMSDLREAVEATPAYERKRETVEQFIRQATNGETVLLDDAGVVELMQSAEGLQTLRDMGLTDEQIQQALAGNDIEVEAAKILVVKNNFDEIVSITRTREGELTLVEAANEAFNEALQVDHDELIASLGDEDMALEGFENVERQVTQMMQEQNQPPEVAAKAGKLWGAFYKRLSEAGLDEQQIFEKLRLQMRGPEPRRQVGQLDIDLDDLRRGAIPSERAAYGSTLQSMARTAGLYDKEGFLKRGVKEDGPLDEFGGMALDKGFFQERPDLNELEAILTSGQPYYRPENRDERRAARRETLLDLENRLDERGLDLNTMTNDEIVKVLMAEETQAEPEIDEDGITYDQSGVINRDENFRRWFGDSKVVDEAGEPLVVYHGTSEQFEAFDPATIGRSGSALGYGFYFSTDKQVAQGYQREGGMLVEAHLSIQKPLNLDQSVFSLEETASIISEIVKSEIALGDTDNYKDTFLSDIVDTYSMSEAQAIQESAKILVSGNDKAVDLIAELSNIGGGKEIVLNAVTASLGYDGIYAPNFQGGEGDVYLAFDPTQIKSVNNRGTFDPNDPRILFQAQQQGFEGTDRGEAEGWLNAKAKGLDMSQEARMERAREMGFDTERTLYHGTGSVFDEFELTGNDINNPLGPGIFMTAKPESAAFFASDHNAGARSNVMPLFIRGNIVDRATINLPFPALLSRRARAAFPDLDEADAVRAWFKDQGIDGLRTSNWEEVTVFDPANIRSVNAAFDPDYSDSGRILFQSAAIRRGEEVLNVPSKERIPKTRDVALALERRQREKYGTIERGDYSDEASEKIADFAVEEVMFEVEQAALNPEKSAVGWYSQKFQTALDVFGDEFPELVGDMDFSKPGVKLLGTQQNARDFFTALIAITSDGAKVEQNFRFAVDVMRGFRETGRIDHQVTFGGERNKSMQINLKNIQTALDDLGPDNLATRLLETDTISNLKKIAKESGQSFSTAYKANMELPYAAVVFGPKLGAFYANLMGEAGYLTMDRWWSRTFNRYRGTLLTQPTEAGLARFKILVSQDQGLNEPPELMTDDEALARTVDYVRSYKAKGYKNGTEIEKAANTLYKAAFEGLEDQPFNASDREFMVNTTIRAQEKLSERGVDLTLADIQAVLWYYEKRLYAELGARATADISYEETARKIIEGDRGSATEKTLGGSELGLDAIGTESGKREVADDIEEKLSQERELFQSGKAPSLRYAAVRVEGQVYTGKDHGEAAIKAEKAIGRPLRNINGEDGQSGFVGSDGKFYLRDEIDAALSALANDQITRDYMAKRIEKAIASGEKLPPLTSDMLTLFQQEGQGPRASVTFDPADILSDKDVLVRLTEAADKTSFLHESAHIFLEIYRSLDDGQNAFITQQMKDIREWLGAEEGKPFTTQQHETFAESFEVYLMEGKAPTRGMRAVFRTFKAWFTDVYRNLPLPKLNPKAREIFDAMLATDDEISAAQQEYTRNLSSTMSGLMDEELVAKYEDQARKAGELAREKLYRKFIDQINKRNSKEYKAAREEVEAQVRADVEARPPYRAFIALTTTDEQIDTKVIEQMRGKSAVAKIPRSKRGVHKKGGAHPDFVASKYGFTSGDAMLTALIGLRPIKETIAAEVEAELKRRFGDIENDGTAQREAIAAVFNEPSIKMMEAERDVLAKQAGKQPIPLEVFKQEAERRIRTMPIKDVIKPGRYAIKARDLHKRSIRSAANGKWDQALRETHQAMLQHELARRAFKAQDEVQRVKAYLKRSQRSMQKKGAEKRIAPEYREQILALLNLPGQPQQSEVLSQLQAFEKAQQADGKPVSLSGIDKPIPDLRDMSMDQLRDYRDNVKNLTKVGRDMSEEARVAKVKVAAELGDEVLKTWGSRNLKRLGGQRTVKTRGEKIRDWVRRKDAEVMRIPFIAEMWQGGKKGKLIDFFDIKLRMAMGQRNKHMADLDRQYVEILERHNITQSELHRVVSVPELTQAGDVKFEALLAVLLNMGSDGNVSRLLGDPMITVEKKEDLIALLEQHLEKRHFDAAQEIWALIDTLRAPAFEQERKLTGVTPKGVDPTALVTSHGTYAGGYYPLRYDPELNRDITEKSAEEMWTQRVAGMAAKAQTKQGFLKERQANVTRPLHLSLSVAMEHFQETTTDIYMREPITQIWDVLKREQFAGAVESTFGGAYLKAMETMLKRTAAGTQAPTSDVEKLLRGARVNATVAILGNNVVTAVLAPISYTQTVLTRYSAITVGRGMVSYYGNVVKANKLINEKSSFMRERTQNINREAHERITKQPFSSAYSRFQGSGFWLMAELEKLTVSGPLWMGVYEQSIMEGKSEAVAVAEADRAVSTTQGSGLEMDQSVLQGGNEMERLVTFMWGYVSSVYGNTRAELGQEGAKRKTLAMVKFIAMSVVISSAIEALLRNGFGDEEDPYVVNWLKMMWRNSIGVLPGAGTFFSRYDARPAAFSAGTSVVEAADAYYKTGETFFEDGELDGEQAGKALLRTFEALGFAAGVPGTVQLNKIERTLLKDDDPTIIEALITGPDDDN